ncbi:peptidylprolyl isomerase [Dactylosporangium sp. CA-139114]|uniref:peptidylprolyl isomerase n=1 Tax=Dactylosporangium sp. CA-139114 TaxID=3239931 RepID=UPI003D99C4A8
MSTPPEPGDPRPPELAEPLPPSAPVPGVPGAVRPESLRDSSPRSKEDPQFPPPTNGGAGAEARALPVAPPAEPPPPASPARRLVPLAGGAVLALAVVAVVAYLVLAPGRESAESIGGPVSAVASGRGPAPQVGGPITTGAQSNPPPDGATVGPTGARTQAPAGVPCAYASADRGEGDSRLIATPAPKSTLTGRVAATIQTNLGPIGIQLYADRAPCTVNSFVHLSRDDFYSDTPCHRLTTDGLYVLQCGDPSGTGTGTPGYQFGEENLPTTVPPYPRGTLAMANAGPGTNGSQFFVVYKDSDIPPDYTVFGTVTSGMDLLDRIAAAGTTTGGPDGPPKLAVQITEIRVA